MSPVTLEPGRLHLGGLIGAAGLAVMLAGCTLFATGQMPGQAHWWPLSSESDATQTRGGGDTLPAQMHTAESPADGVDFIVRIKDVDAVDKAVSLWRRDRGAAVAAFNAWAANEPAFAGMRLVGCSYSGEVILRHVFEPAAAASESQVDALLERIRGHENVAYADPDFTARVGETE